MRTLAAITILGAALVTTGCSCGAAHELDDAGADARASDDAGHDAAADALAPEDHYFTLERADALEVIVERCAENEGATAMLRVTVHLASACDTPGPIDATPDATTHLVTVVAHAWHEHGRADCAASGASYTRDVALSDLTAGAWTIPGLAAPLVVDAAPTLVCPAPGGGTIAAGQMCRRDCECVAGLACLALRGDAACARFCADPCEPVGVGADLSLSCASGDACTSDPNLGWTCASSTVSECPCPAGMTCPPVSEGPPQCVWSIMLDGATRHACTNENECMPGLDCVQRPDGVRACEVRCTTSDMACPNNAPHACLAGNWVCEWLGE